MEQAYEFTFLRKEHLYENAISLSLWVDVSSSHVIKKDLLARLMTQVLSFGKTMAVLLGPQFNVKLSYLSHYSRDWCEIISGSQEMALGRNVLKVYVLDAFFNSKKNELIKIKFAIIKEMVEFNELMQFIKIYFFLFYFKINLNTSN